MTQAQLDGTLKEFSKYHQVTEQTRKEAIASEGIAHAEAWGESRDMNLSIVRRALKQNDADGALKDLLDSTGFGNHPVVLDFLLGLGNNLKEGGFLKGANNVPAIKASAAQKLFGKTQTQSH